ncbi:hypothetical protein KAT45_01700, partial [Candidatus Aerophobetes bacterium]|nr:hypothetical protein [Candidatus Aerophobetes bacterium]
MQVDIHNESSEPLKIYSVGINFSTYPVEYRGAFSSSDELLNQIWGVARYTLQLSMQDAYIDGPFREQAQWIGDAHVEALANYYTFGDTRLIARCLRQIGQSQLPEGITSAVWPKKWPSILPDYSLLWIISLWDYYQYTDNRDLVEELYPRVKRALAWFESYLDQYSLLSDVSGQIFIDWADLDKRGEITVLNCFYYKALVDTSQMAQLLGKKDEAVQYQQLATEVKAAINSRLWSNDIGVYVDCRVGDVLSKTISQHANSLAVLYDIAEVDKQDRIYSYILARGKGVVGVGTPYFMFYVLQALFHSGRYQEAVEIIRERWGEMLKKGATTFWEVFGDWSPSRCHGWSSGPAMLLSAEILGVQPIAPGFKVFQIQPHPVDLTWAKGVVPIPLGNISVAWQEVWEEAENETFFELKVYIPEGTTGEVLVPGLNPRVSLNDLVLWSQGKIKMKPRGVKKVEREDNNLRVTLEGAGGYQFKVMQLTIIPIEGYGGTRWKNSPEEVHQVFPEKEFSDLGHPVIDFGSRAIDELVDFFYFEDRILDKKVTINFYFFKDQLFQVKIYRRAGEFSFYQILSELLKEKYGKPVQEEIEPDNKLARTLWLGDGLNVIELSFNPKSLLFPGITISYIDTALEKELSQTRRQREELKREEVQKKL